MTVPQLSILIVAAFMAAGALIFGRARVSVPTKVIGLLAAAAVGIFTAWNIARVMTGPSI